MMVYKHGKVTVLKFYLHNFRPLSPERRIGVKELFKKLRLLFPCKMRVITADKLEELVIKTFGSDYEYYVFISDYYFRTIDKETMEKLLREDDTNTLPYVAEIADCDDFSDVLLGSLTKKTWTQGFAIGQLWYYTERFGHAVNLFCDGEKIYVVEPQNDQIIEWCRDQDYCGKAYMVKF